MAVPACDLGAGGWPCVHRLLSGTQRSITDCKITCCSPNAYPSMYAFQGMVYLELACSAQPHVVDAGQLGHTIAGLVHSDAAHVAAHELVRVEVHVAVADAAPVPSPPHLRSHAKRSGLCICSYLLMDVKQWGTPSPSLENVAMQAQFYGTSCKAEAQAEPTTLC